MMLLTSRLAVRQTNPVMESHHPASQGHAAFRQIDANKLRAKRLRCKTCDGKFCVGRCRFEKLN